MPRGGSRPGAGRKRTRPEKPAPKQAPITPPVVEHQPAAVNPLLAKCTRREQAFILNLLADPAGNQTKAYEGAGFKARGESACANAAKCLGKDRVRAAFDSLRGVMLASEQSKAIADATERRELLTRHARAITNPVAGIKAMDILNKMDGVYIQKHEHSGPDGAPVEVRFVDV